MGCATSKSKQKKQILCQNCQAHYVPVSRSYSMHPQSAQKERESFHVVALSSTTLGSLKLDLLDHKHCIKEEVEEDSALPIDKKEEFAMGMVEAKTWSKMIDQKITKIVPKTPTRTPPGEPETIDAWELMSGLENTSPLFLKHPFHHIRSFSFHLTSDHNQSFDDYPTPNIQENEAIKPFWLEKADNEFDSTSKDQSFHVTNDSKKMLNGNDEVYNNPIVVKEKLVVYFTSLRGVRKTYEDCCNVRGILKGLRVKIDERDVSMHSGFKDELKELLGEEWYKGGALPKVFIGKRYIGGVEEIRRMHEEGWLEKAELVDDGGEGGVGGVCEACGDVRFVPCDTCCGSCKIYYEGDYDEEYKESEYGFQRCPHCNENGLVRCPICCDS